MKRDLLASNPPPPLEKVEPNIVYFLKIDVEYKYKTFKYKNIMNS